jgi:Uma2 family endonuclease
VLSDSTEAYDRGDKFAAYRTMPTFQEYVLIDQTRPHVEHYIKQSVNQWLFTEYDDREATVTFASFAAAIAMSELYETIEFAEQVDAGSGNG